MSGWAFNIGDAVSISLGGLMMTRSRAVNRIGFSGVVFLMLATLWSTPAAATVIRSVDGRGNTSAPGDDPGWDNVGALGSAGAVYLGNRGVLTAAHVWNESLSAVNFAGASYGIVAGSWIGLHDPDDPGTKADLGLLRITSAPPTLANLRISQSIPNASEVVGIGFGQDRAASETSWDSDWNEVSPPGAYTGFKLEATHTKRWGENYVDGTEPIGIGSPYKTHALVMDFDQFGGAGDDEMQAVPGDSGGGLFYKNGSDWELAGIWIARTTYSQHEPKQPETTAVYGNMSLAADLSQYRGQIMAIVPEPSMLVMLLGVGMGCLVWSFWRRASR